MTDAYPTAEYFDLFRSEVEGWVHRFGLLNWRVRIYHDLLVDGGRAQCAMDEDSRTAHIALTTLAADEFTERDIALWAFHEVCELLMADIEAFGNKPHPLEQNEELRRLVHEAIVRLENTLFDGYWKARQGKEDPGRVRPDRKRAGHKH